MKEEDEEMKENGDTELEMGEEAKENMKKRGSWMKTISMRTLRLRKNEKKLPKIPLSAENEPNSNKDDDKPNLNNEVVIPPNNLNILENSSNSQSVPSSPIGPKEGKNRIKNEVKSSRLSLREQVRTRKGLTPNLFNNGTVKGANSKSLTNGNSKGHEKEKESIHLDKVDPSRFSKEGLTFRGKLIGILEVSGPRGDKICQEALSELKMAVRAAGEHKQKVTIHVALDGLRLRDEKTTDCLYHHQVHKISFIAQDMSDSRAFGYIYGSPDSGHRFFGIKTEKSASVVVMGMRDLFQVVFDLKKKEIERAKAQLELQQKFLATRATETGGRSFQKSGIAETYIEGACSQSGETESPAEADLLNLEVELTSLQAGLDNFTTSLITNPPLLPFNRGSTPSLLSDNMGTPSSNQSKGSGILSQNTGGFGGSSSGFERNTGILPQNGGGFGGGSTGFSANSGGMPQNAREATTLSPQFMLQRQSSENSTKSGGSNLQVNDPFGDSFDPFDDMGQSSKYGVPFDPFGGVDPFPANKFEESREGDPFDNTNSNSTPAHHFNFGNENILSSVNKESRKFSGGAASGSSDQDSVDHPHISNLFQKEQIPTHNSNWTAAFEDNFSPDSASVLNSSGNSGSALDLFTDLDPLGTGKIKPFVDRKDFFNDLKNPTKKMLRDLSAPLPLPPPIQNNQNINSQKNICSLLGNITIKSDPQNSPNISKDLLNIDRNKDEDMSKLTLTNSFSTNFSPSPINIDNSKILKGPPGKKEDFLRSGNTPPSYSPPPPPPNLITNEIYFTEDISKKSPIIFRNMSIGKEGTADAKGEKALPPVFPNLIPPLRPPQSGSSLNKDKSSIALPRPHSGEKSKKSEFTLQSNSFKTNENSAVRLENELISPPEPPPRPIGSFNNTNIESFIPPPLPPKKQNTPNSSSLSSTLSRVSNFTIKAKGESLGSSNELPLPLPLRKSTNSSIFQSQDHSKNMSKSDENDEKIRMESALNQVASLSLSQLAAKLNVPVEALSSCTIQELALKLTLLDNSTNLSENTKLSSQEKSENNALFSSNKEFSTNLSARNQSAINGALESSSKNESYDRYAVFRELEDETTSLFSEKSDIVQNNLFSDKNELENSLFREKKDAVENNVVSRESSSEKTLQADGDEVEREGECEREGGVSTVDEITDVLFSDDDYDEEEEECRIFDEINDGPTISTTINPNLNPNAKSNINEHINATEWASFETSLLHDDKNGDDSPWDSDGDKNEPIKEQFEFQLFEKSTPKHNLLDEDTKFNFEDFERPREPKISSRVPTKVSNRGMSNSVKNREISKGNEGFSRGGSGSSKHSERSGGGGVFSKRNNSDYSDSHSGKERRRSGPERRSSRGSDSFEAEGEFNPPPKVKNERSISSRVRRSSNKSPHFEEEGESEEESEGIDERGRRHIKHNANFEEEDSEGRLRRPPKHITNFDEKSEGRVRRHIKHNPNYEEEDSEGRVRRPKKHNTNFEEEEEEGRLRRSKKHNANYEEEIEGRVRRGKKSNNFEEESDEEEDEMSVRSSTHSQQMEASGRMRRRRRRDEEWEWSEGGKNKIHPQHYATYGSRGVRERDRAYNYSSSGSLARRSANSSKRRSPPHPDSHSESGEEEEEEEEINKRIKGRSYKNTKHLPHNYHSSGYYDRNPYDYPPYSHHQGYSSSSRRVERGSDRSRREISKKSDYYYDDPESEEENEESDDDENYSQRSSMSSTKNRRMRGKKPSKNDKNSRVLTGSPSYYLAQHKSQSPSFDEGDCESGTSKRDKIKKGGERRKKSTSGGEEFHPLESSLSIPSHSPFEDNFTTNVTSTAPLDFFTPSFQNETNFEIEEDSMIKNIPQFEPVEKNSKNEPVSQESDKKWLGVIRENNEDIGEGEMKKSDSLNIFEREKDPFADDDFFT